MPISLWSLVNYETKYILAVNKYLLRSDLVKCYAPVIFTNLVIQMRSHDLQKNWANNSCIKIQETIVHTNSICKFSRWKLQSVEYVRPEFKNKAN